MTTKTQAGAMIAAKLSDDDAKRIAVDGGESVDELHLTLHYLGDAENISNDDRERILEAVVSLAQNAAPVEGELFSVAVFNPTGFVKKDGKDRDSCIVGGVGDSSGDLTVLKRAIDAIFTENTYNFSVPDQHTPWVPHITLKYAAETDVSPYVDRAGPVVFDGLRVTFGDEVYDVPLGAEDGDEEAPIDVDVDDDGEIIVPNVLLDLNSYVETFRKEGKVRLPGAGHNLRNYWIYGKGAAKIRWGTEGSMKRCIRNLRKYVRDPGGLCATYHKVATGEWPRGGTVPSSVDVEDQEALTAAMAYPVTHAGLALVAANTGRTLMLQRSVKDDEDPAAGTWEFPGGSIESGESALEAAMREWAEEIGQPVPSIDVMDVWHSLSGTYRGFVMITDTENSVTMTDGRVVVNPDDPDGDDSEQAAWWDVRHARDNPALREELQIGAGEHSPWCKLEKIADMLDGSSE